MLHIGTKRAAKTKTSQRVKSARRRLSNQLAWRLVLSDVAALIVMIVAVLVAGSIAQGDADGFSEHPEYYGYATMGITILAALISLGAKIYTCKKHTVQIKTSNRQAVTFIIVLGTILVVTAGIAAGIMFML